MRLLTVLFFCLLLNGCTGCQSRQSKINTASDKMVAEADNYALTQLGYACCKGDLEEVKKMLREGANVKGCITDDIYEYDLVYAAVYFEKTDILEFLIERKEDLNIIYAENGLTALSLACKKSNVEITSLLLEGGADADGGGYPNSGYTTCPLIEAVSNDNVELVKLLLQYNADLAIAGTDFEGNSPLDIAFNNKNDRIIELLKNGVKKN